MRQSSRRLFISSSFATLGTGSFLLGQDEKMNSTPVPESFLRKLVPEIPSFQPSTLFLTWHKDPTTTMVVQWIGTAGETADNTIAFSDEPAAVHPPRREPGARSQPVNLTWRTQKPVASPYPHCDFKVFRA